MKASGAMQWSAEQYVSFEDERTRPVRDLLNAVFVVQPRAAIDLGCGPGNSTEVLAQRFPGAVITGLDNSPDMIAAARRRLPALSFEIGAIETWSGPGPYDVILANAALHWVANHARILPDLVGRLRAGGSLAVQMPDNLDEPAHVLMRALAADGTWADRLAKASAARTGVESAAWYYERLRPLCRRVDIWRTTYHHPLAGPDSIVEWFKGSGLRPFLAPLEAPEQQTFLARYRACLADAYPAMPDGTVLLPFPRLFIVANR
jgi:trans-aconitate 2-methyltransferase